MSSLTCYHLGYFPKLANLPKINKSDIMKNKATITLRLEPATKEILNLICSVKNISVNEYINQLITEKVSEVEPATLQEIEKLKKL